MKTINFLTFAFCLFFSVSLSAQDNCENDTTPPVTNCLSSLAITLDENNEITLFAIDVDNGSFDACSDVTFSFFPNMIEDELGFTENSMSPANLDLYITDASGNQSFCQTTITITGSTHNCDNPSIAPVAVCNDGETIYLNENNEAILDITVIDGGSYDFCSGVTVSFSETEQVNTLTFDESTASPTTVILYASDVDGNQSSCWAHVHINEAPSCDNDTTAPWAICNDRINIHLNPNGETSLHVEDVDDGSFDVCSAVTLSFFENMLEETILVDEDTQSPSFLPLFVTDASGNQSSCHAEIVINGQTEPDCTNDDEAPIAICNAEITVYLDANQQATLSINTVNEQSYDNCSAVILSFSETEVVTTMDFDENSTSPTNVFLYVTDANGNKNSCWGTVNIEQGETGEGVFGYVKTEAGEGLQATMVSAVDANGQVAEIAIVDANGRYEFANLIIGATYTIQPAKNTNPLNGVTTFDMVLERRHILAIQQLSPYKIFAGDVNNSNAITTFDMVLTRKLILGYEPEFEEVGSWKFIRSTAVFPNLNQFDLGDIQNNSFELTVGETNSTFDFIGVKAGDTNGSASNN